jgi:hypothetical protein
MLRKRSEDAETKENRARTASGIEDDVKRNVDSWGGGTQIDALKP